MTDLTREEREYFEQEIVEIMARYHGLWHPEWKKRVVSVSGKVDWLYAPEIYDLVNKDLETMFRKWELEKK